MRPAILSGIVGQLLANFFPVPKNSPLYSFDGKKRQHFIVRN